MHSIAGFILAGGESRRMGRDKSRLMLDGHSFVDRVANEMVGIASTVAIVGNIAGEPVVNKSGETQTNLRTVPDVYPKWGALGGVHAALANCTAEWALVVACDFPFVTKDLFVRLASFRDNFDAVTPIQPDQIPQPLCALYRVEPCRDQAERMIKSGERKPIALLQSLRTRWVAFLEIEDLPGAPRFFDNINTPRDYDRISRKGG